MITPLRSDIPIRRFTAYDFEWVPGTMRLRWAGSYDERGYRGYETIKAWIEGELTHTNRGRWLYAHAGGLADAQFILWAISNELTDAGFVVEASFSGSSAIIIKVHRHRNVWTLIDSYWTFRSPLSDIAKMLGMVKGSASYPDPNAEGLTEQERERRMDLMRGWYANVSLAELKTYNEQDCLILYKAIDLFQHWIIDEGGQMNATFASTAMATFRRVYLKHDIQTSDKVNAIARQAYVGGRVEVFERRCQSAFGYDINSSYPYAMARGDAPGSFVASCRIRPTTHTLYLADCEIEVPEAPITPLFYRQDSKLYFPSGRWRGWFMGEDLAALEEGGGRTLKVHDCLVFAPFDALQDYATTLFERRKTAESDAEKMFIKYLLNSLYGKFGESPDKQGLVINPSRIDLDRMEMLAPGIWTLEHRMDIPHEHVPIAAHITASGRRHLFGLMGQCERVFYCDTDGFLTTDRHETSTALGGLKLEKIWESWEGFAPKVYGGSVWPEHPPLLPHSVHRAKGFSRLTYDGFIKLTQGEVIEREMMTRIRGNARLRQSLEPFETTIGKRLKLDIKDAKRYYYPDGSSRPWTVTELSKFSRK